MLVNFIKIFSYSLGIYNIPIHIHEDKYIVDQIYILNNMNYVIRDNFSLLSIKDLIKIYGEKNIRYNNIGKIFKDENILYIPKMTSCFLKYQRNIRTKCYDYNSKNHVLWLMILFSSLYKSKKDFIKGKKLGLIEERITFSINKIMIKYEQRKKKVLETSEYNIIINDVNNLKESLKHQINKEKINNLLNIFDKIADIIKKFKDLFGN